MNEIFDFIKSKKHLAFRKRLNRDLAKEFSDAGLCEKERVTRRFEIMCENENAVILPGEKICLTRTIDREPEIFTSSELSDFKGKFTLPESGHISNLTPDYGRVMELGFDTLRTTLDVYGQREIDAISKLVLRYRNAALKNGDSELAKVLRRVPAKPPRTFRQALQFCRIIHFACILDGCHHVTIGRFDKYMYPYYKADIESGRMTEGEAYELIREFFLSFNKDSDICSRVQLGDNGQSLVLGGCDGNGGEIFNELTEMALRASRENMLIDPKINLRVSSKTPLKVFIKGTELTRAGLGFPQYSNDDVVIPALIKMGYDKRDAEDYVTAACWEFIVPGCGADIPNIAVMPFAAIIDTVLHRDLISCHDFTEFKECVAKEISAEARKINKRLVNIKYFPSPFMSAVLFEKDVSKGGKYNNFGIHGSGIATAADSMTAIKKYVFDQKSVTPKEMIQAVDSDFSGFPKLLHMLRFSTPKMGQNDSEADEMGVFLLNAFANALQSMKNSRGGIYRAGTGTAMNYLCDVENLPASPDGRRRGEPLGANYSPSLFAKVGGPMSVISSFTKPKLENTCNGGPLTLEFHSGIFDSEDAVAKTAALVKSYIDMGGHQLQLNAVNVEELRRAQANPQDYKNLIVRIWGWSAYFTELDKPYQDHVISRQEYKL